MLCSLAIAITSLKKSKSTQLVVGLLGKLMSNIFGFGKEFFIASFKLLKKSMPGPIGT